MFKVHSCEKTKILMLDNMSEIALLINSNSGNRKVQCFSVAGSSKLGLKK